MPIVVPDYKAPSWCPGGHLQTVIPAKFMPRPAIEYRREKVELPDGDFNKSGGKRKSECQGCSGKRCRGADAQ